MADDKNKETSSTKASSDSGGARLTALQKELALKKQIDVITAVITENEVKQQKVKSSLFEIEKKLNEVKSRQAKSDEELQKNLEEYNKLLEEQRDLREEQEEARKDEKKFNEQRNKSEVEYNSLVEKRTSLNEELNKAADEQVAAIKLLEKAQARLTGNAAEYRDTFDKSALILEEIQTRTESAIGIQEKQGSLSSQYMMTMQSSAGFLKTIASIQGDITKEAENASKGEYQRKDFKEQIADLDKREVLLQELKTKQAKGLSDVTADELQDMEMQLVADKQHLDYLQTQNDTLANTSDKSKQVLKNFDNLTTLDIKGFLTGSFGLDKIQSEVKEKLGGAFVNVAKEYNEKGLIAGLKATGKEAGGLMKLGPKLIGAFAITGIVTGVMALGRAVMHADEEVANLGKEFGVSYKEARGLHHAAIDISNEMGLTGIQAKEVTAAMADVGEMMGGIDIAAQMSAGNEKVKELVKQTAVLTKQFGLSGEEVGKIQDLATITGKSMDNLVKESVELGKGTMTAKQSLKVLSTIPPQVAVAFKGSTKELIAAAQKAKMLGMELGKVQDIGRGMLDIEQSLEAEMEARVLTGKNLNLDAARQYALQGDTFKLQEEILNQAGSLEDFTKMNTLQQESMAKALGMSVEEMTKMLTNAEKLKKADISSDYAARLDAMESAAELEKEAAGARSKEQKDYIMQLAAEKRSASLKETMASLLEKIKAKFAPIIDAVLGVVGGLKDGNAGVSKFEEIISQIDFKEIAEQVKAVLPKLIEGFTTLIKKLPDIIKMVVSFVEKLSGGIGPVTSIMGMINPGIAGFGIMALKIGGPGGVATGLKLAAGGAKSLFDLVKGPLQDGIGKLAGGVTDKLGGAFGKVTDKAKTGLSSVMEKMGKSKMPEAPTAGKGGAMDSIGKMFEKMDPKKMLAGAAALLIVAAALYVAAKAMQEFSTGVSWEGVMMGIVTLGALVLAVVGLGTLMSSGVGAVAIIAGAGAMLILSGAMYVMGKAMQEFAKAAVIAIPVFETLFKGVVSIIAAAGQVIVNVINAFTGGITTIIDSFAKLGSLNPAALLGVAAGITAIGFALAGFGVAVGAGGMLGGITGSIGKLFGGESPMEMVVKISEKLKPEKLSATAIAIRDLATAFKFFAEETSKLANFDTNKLEEIIEKMEEVKDIENSGALSKSVAGVATAVTGFIGNLFGSPEKQSTQPVSAGGGSVAVAASGGGGTNMANVEKKLDTLISVISQAANQPLVIKFGEKTVEEIKSQLNFKASTDIGVNKGYAKTI
jgi:hypothetical protein